MSYIIRYFRQGCEAFEPEEVKTKAEAARRCRDFVTDCYSVHMKRAGFKIIKKNDCWQIAHPVYHVDTQAKFFKNLRGDQLMTRIIPKHGPGTLSNELNRTAEMLVDIAERQGVFYAVALLYDSSYDTARIKALLPVLQAQRGAIKK